MAFSKITSDMVQNKGVIGLPDTPNLNVTEMQQKFEEIPREVIIPFINALIDSLNATTGSTSLGAKSTPNMSGVKTTVQDVLDGLDEMAHELAGGGSFDVNADNGHMIQTLVDGSKKDLGPVAFSAKGVYDPELAYEKFSVVQYETGSYVARRNVPKSILPTSEDYWTKFADTDAAIEVLQREIDKRETSMGFNVITYPYTTGYYYTEGGLNFNADESNHGAIRIYGSTTKQVTYVINDGLMLQTGTYTLSGGMKTESGTPQVYITVYSKTDGATIALDTGNGASFTIPYPSAVKITMTTIMLGTWQGILVKPMLELGTVQHTFGDTTANLATITKRLDNMIRKDNWDVNANEWVENDDDDTKDTYPFIYNISTPNTFADGATPLWMILDFDENVPSGTDLESARAIAYAFFNSMGIKLYATERPLTSVELIVKGVV